MAAASAISARSWLLLNLVAMLWGSSFMFFEIGLAGLPPLTLVAVRCLSAFGFMLLLFGARRAALAGMWRHRRQLVVLGLAGTALPFSCYALGQQHVASSTAGTINALMPLFTLLLAILAGQERFAPARLAGVLLGLAGVAVLLGPDGVSDPAELAGAALCVGATICYGVYAVLLRRYALPLAAGAVATGMVGWGALAATGLALGVEGLPAEWPDTGPVAAGFALGIGGTAVAYRLFVGLIGSLGATNASLATFLIPPYAIAFGALLLGERIDAWFGAGALVILASLLLVDERLRRLLRRGRG
ncbi:MAG: DMT family transporter [Betaproteobacteria bacterium AqS2]|uniref:DMT family transporter n=1 Tax=Candidatus Amphirhobacter heronislandensis TaxID=1732024 RepID=A0A930XWC7_9GAMM|nr:DMT family transporter [Betaproteobacteria bacterium AqS2]